MDKKSKRIIAGLVVVIVLLICSWIPALASNLDKTIVVAYRDIKIYIDGSLITPKDVTGRIVEPFIYEGTTYLPVRAVSEALGKEVDWDPKTYSVYVGEPISQEIKEVTVSTAEELIRELGSNKRILLEKGVYNLSTVKLSDVNNTAIHFDDAYDGPELRLDGVHNLTIQGVDGAQSEIVIEPRYAFVMNFQNCSDISIIDIKAGHTEGGYCEGGVFSFANSSGIKIDKTFMYGCGTVGLNLEKVSNVAVTNSSIYECTYYIMTVGGSENISFANCIFRNNGEFDLVSVNNTSDFVIDNCEFKENTAVSMFGKSAIFAVSLSDNVIVKNTKFIANVAKELGSISEITFENNVFTDNKFDDNTGVK